ncbi:hypothetical protein M513_10229 [Trichuris suis]|uniref:Integrase zinc-binding domain-containing protein n=1 Tax=Trichuris suis TaxID=68888 RepID=A0A085LV70_9BILA|nr:hypothetical protein M513_10229 [Trichuris suis]
MSTESNDGLSSVCPKQHPRDTIYDGLRDTMPHARGHAQSVQLKAGLMKVHINAHSHLRNAALRQKQSYDRVCAGSRHHVGDWVFLRSPKPYRGQRRKLQMRWLGSYCILARLSSVAYRIR